VITKNRHPETAFQKLSEKGQDGFLVKLIKT
jgi:hypothetical protein